MKFILQEDKFLLNENQSFILEERFILNEADLLEAGATLNNLKTTITTLETLLPKVLGVITAGLTLEIPATVRVQGDPARVKRQIKSECERAQKLLSTEHNFKDLLAKMMARVKTADSGKEYSKEELINVEPLCDRIKEDINGVISRFSNIKRNNGDISKQFNTLKDILPRLNDNIEKLYNFFSSKKAHVYSLVKSEISLRVNDTYKLASLIKVTPAKEFKATFKVDNEKLATIDNNGTLKAIAEGKTLIRITVEDQLFKCICRIEGPDSNPSISTKDSTDWRTKLASAVNKETVIEEFIYTTWPKEAGKVLKIKQAVLQECEHYGFLKGGNSRNPFISFISNIYLNPAYNVKPQTYNIIHNLVAKGNVLRAKDLDGTGVMGAGNLVFCKAFYTLDDGAIKLYATKQANLLNATKLPDIFDSVTEMAFNALYSVSKVQKGRDTRKSADMQLRSMTQVEQLEERWTGVVSTTEKVVRQAVTNAELLNKIKTTAEATKLLVALALKFSSNDKITDIVQAYAESNHVMKKATTAAEIQELMTSIERVYSLENLESSKALSLAKSIVESDLFDFTKE